MNEETENNSPCEDQPSESSESSEEQRARTCHVRIFNHNGENIIIPMMGFNMGSHDYNLTAAVSGTFYPDMKTFHKATLDRDRHKLLKGAISKLTQTEIDLLGVQALADEARWG